MPGVLAFLVLAAAGAWYGPSWLHGAPQASAQLAPPALPVTVSPPLQRRLAAWTEFTGQFSAVDTVELRAQVSGYLTEIHFTDGQIVHKGDLLFVIDPRPYEIALQQAQAQLLTAAAGLDLANKRDRPHDRAAPQRLRLRRAARPARPAAARRRRRRSSRPRRRSARPQLNLEFTRITAPLTGRISAHRVSIGNLIAGGQSGGAPTLLTTIVSLDPIHLDFDMSESDYLAYQRFLQAHSGGQAVDRTVEARLYRRDRTGRAAARSISSTTRSTAAAARIHARATLPNPDLFVAAGQFARLRLPTSAPKPDAAGARRRRGHRPVAQAAS